MKPRILLISFLWITLACAQDNNSAYKFIYSIYSHYQNDNMDFRFKGPGADTIFSPDLLGLFRLDEKLAQGMVGYLDFDPLCECQLNAGFKMNKVTIFNKSGITYADVKFKMGNSNNALILQLEKIKEKWLIRDITSSTGSLY
jgi:hypothetical protein